MGRPRLIYLSEGSTTHDRRFLALALHYGWVPYWMRCDGRGRHVKDPDMPDGVVVVDWLGSHELLTSSSYQPFIDALRLTASAIGPSLIQAGPIPTVGYLAVSSMSAPVLLTSWGSDLLRDVDAPERRSRAVAALHGGSRLLVDCQTVALAAAALGAPSDRTAVVPWGVDLQAFAYAAPRVQPGRLRLLSLRSLEPVYDVATLLYGFATAIHAANDCALTLSIAGAGSQEAELRKLADDLRVSRSVKWFGRVPAAGIASLLRDHDVHVSTALSDGSAISLLEALASGRPSIVTDLRSNLEWIAPGVTGWVFEAGNPDSLARTILQAVSVRGEFTEMAERGRAVAQERADWNRNGRLIANLYSEVGSRVVGR